MEQGKEFVDIHMPEKKVAQIEKQCFSMMYSESIRAEVSRILASEPQAKFDIFLYGIFSEACVLQTVLDLQKLREADLQSVNQIFVIEEGT